MTKHIRTAWAIRFGREPCFTGIYWWVSAPEHMDGYRTATFSTRAAALRALRSRPLPPGSRVERVRIEVRTETTGGEK
jgi:hypothetical protein